MKFGSTCFTTLLLMVMAGIGIANRTSSVHARRWCSHATAKVVVGDFNGNGLDDAMCYDDEGRHWIVDDSIFIQKIIGGSCDGSYGLGSPKYLENMTGWCTHADATRHFADFNGDGRTDALCHDLTRPLSIRIAASDQNNGLQLDSIPDVDETLAWCGGPYGSFHTGDFNGDGRADVLCIDKNLRKIWIRIAEVNGILGKDDAWLYDEAWCFGREEELHVADFNGDGQDDLLCRLKGSKWIAYAEVSRTAFTGFSFRLHNYHMDGFCESPGDSIMMAYLNEDQHADLICRDIVGNTWTHLNNPRSRFDLEFSQPFSFCPGEDNRFLVGNFIDTEKQQLMCATNPEWEILLQVL